MKQEELVGQRIRAALSDRRWRQSNLVRATGLDKNTISAVVNGRQRASDATLGRIEDALGMTRGTLAAAGEDAPAAGPSPDLAGASPEDLLAALTHKVLGLREENALLAGRVERLEARLSAEPEGADLHAVPDWARSAAARTSPEPKGVPEPPGEEDVNQDPGDWPGDG